MKSKLTTIMSWIEKRKNCKCWIACWKQGSRKKRRSTGIRIEAGAAGRHTRALAEQTAAAMEAAATGETPAHKACDAVRKVAELHGCAGKIPTVREYLDAFPRTAGMSTEINRTRAFKLFLEYLGTDADRRIDTITPAICRGFVQHELKRVARGTVGVIRSSILSAFRRAVEVDDYMNKNPMAAVTLADEARAVNPDRGQDRQERKNFTLEEIRFMLEHFPDPWSDMVAVSFFLGGLRLSDVCKLRWDAVNWRDRYIRLVEVKTGKERLLPIVDELMERLNGRLLRSLDGEEYVFPEMAHAYLGSSKTNISTQFTAILRAHGMIAGAVDAGKKKGSARHAVSEKSFHSIRHTVTTYLRGGMTGTAMFSPDVIRDTVGHDSEEVERGYFHGALAMRRNVLATLAEGVEGVAPTLNSPAATAYRQGA